MNPERIEANEVLFRAVQIHPNLWKGSRPSSVLFRNDRGVSVDRGGERAENEVCELLQSHLSGYELKAIISVTAKKCKDICVLPLPKYMDENPYHAEIHESETEVLISKAKARLLAMNCQIVKEFSG
jgi:hypothetical protein